MHSNGSFSDAGHAHSTGAKAPKRLSNLKTLISRSPDQSPADQQGRSLDAIEKGNGANKPTDNARVRRSSLTNLLGGGLLGSGTPKPTPQPQTPSKSQATDGTVKVMAGSTPSASAGLPAEAKPAPKQRRRSSIGLGLIAPTLSEDEPKGGKVSGGVVRFGSARRALASLDGREGLAIALTPLVTSILTSRLLPSHPLLSPRPDPATNDYASARFAPSLLVHHPLLPIRRPRRRHRRRAHSSRHPYETQGRSTRARTGQRRFGAIADALLHERLGA